MQKITLEEHFISPEYAQHVRDLQSTGAGTAIPAEFEELLADPMMRKGIEAKNNVMITTSANCSPEALLCALLTVGADHLLFSTDYPYASMERTTQFVETAQML
jgi:predicted TIM-barrel fold metal-dependent hydrolase